VLGFETLTDVHWTMSGLVILMTLVGGMGTLAGPMLGAIIIIALENKLGDWGTLLARITGIEWFNTIGEAVNMVVGLIFIICVLLFRRGIIGEFIALAGKEIDVRTLCKSKRLCWRWPASQSPPAARTNIMS
jgi:branched-chain amino acid transport system permease protein